MQQAPARLERRLTLGGAAAANMLAMIGVGPFLTIPLLVSSMGGPQAMLGWLLGAAVILCDGLVWAELGAALPEAGGGYHYLAQAFGPRKLGALMSFLFLWSVVVTGPLALASGAVGFAQYALYLWPAMTPATGKAVAFGVCAAACALNYRRIDSVGRLSLWIFGVVMAAVGWVVIDGLLNADVKLLTDVPPNAFRMDGAFWTGLGGATLIAAYDYGGYNTVCFLGGEVERPGRTIPGAILLALGAVVAMYVVMSSTILGVLPWREAMHSKYIVSDFVARLHGRGAAMVMTGLILATAFASVFAGMLGLARVPFAAASEGRFFRPFAQLHAEGFPSFSVLYIGAGSAVASLLTMDELVKALIVIQTLIQSLALVVAVTALRRTRPELPRPFRMWGYPVTSVVAFAGWSYIIATSGVVYIGSAGGLLVVGVGAYLLRARRAEEWPWLAGKR